MSLAALTLLLRIDGNLYNVFEITNDANKVQGRKFIHINDFFYVVSIVEDAIFEDIS